MSGRRFALVAGVGTGGHLVPALAVARALAAGPRAGAVEIVGSRRGLEADCWRGTGLPVTRLPAGAFARSRPRRVVANVGARSSASGGRGRGRSSGRRAAGADRRWWWPWAATRCVPGGPGRRVLGVPVVLVNLDAVPGAASRLVGRFARAAAVAFAGTPCPAPWSPAPRCVPRSWPPPIPTAGPGRGPRALGLPADRFVVGGGGGVARGHGASTRPPWPWPGCGPVGPTWPSTTWWGDATRLGGAGRGAGRRSPGASCYRAGPLRGAMDRFYQAADVVVGRAGANTVAELAVVGVPVDPRPPARRPRRPPDGRTPRVAGAPGAAVVVADAECTRRAAGGRDRRPAAPPGATGGHGRRRPRARGRADAVAAVVAALGRATPGRFARRAARRARHPGRLTRAGAAEASTCRLAPADPLVGVGGAGMSAIASVLAAMGHTVTGSDLKASPATERLAAARGGGVHRPRRAHVGEADVVTVSTAIRRRNPRCSRPGGGASPCCSRAEATAAIAACRRLRGRCRGPTGRRRRRRCWPSSWSRRDCSPSFLIGGDINEIGTNAVWDTGEWLVHRGRRERRHVPGARSRDRRGHQRGARPSRLLRGLRRSSWPPSTASDAAGRAAWWWGPTTPWPPRWGGAHGADLVGTAAERHLPDRGLTAAGDGVSFDLSRAGERARDASSLPVTGANIARNAAVARWPPCDVGAPFDDAVRAFARFAGVARRFECAGRGAAGCASSTTTPTCRPRCAAVLEAARQTGPGRLVVVFQPHRYSRIAALGEQFADAFSAPTWWSSPTSSPPASSLVPGVTGRMVADAVAAAPPATSTSPTSPGGPSCARHVAGAAAPGRPVPDPRGRRPHLAARRAAGGAAVVSAGPARPTDGRGALDAVADALGARAVRHAPLGARTTYRVGGDGRGVGRGGRRGRSGGRAPRRWPRPAGRCRCWCSGNGLEPARGRRRVRRLVVVLGAGVRLGRDRRGTTVRRRRRRPSCPLVARRSAAAGLARARVGRRRPGLGGRGAAHERRGPRFGHGRRAGAGAGLRPRPPGPARRRRLRPTSPSATGTRSLAAPTWWSWAEFALAPAGPAEAEAAVRRDRALAPGSTSPAGPTPGRCSPTPPATPPGGWWRRRG